VSSQLQEVQQQHAEAMDALQQEQQLAARLQQQLQQEQQRGGEAVQQLVDEQQHSQQLQRQLAALKSQMGELSQLQEDLDLEQRQRQGLETQVGGALFASFRLLASQRLPVLACKEASPVGWCPLPDMP
jgi:hypothetical protein